MRLMIPALLVSTLVFTNLNAAENRPNVLLIFTDDQSDRTVSCYPNAHSWVNTPNIDKLAREGVRFNSIYMAPFCVPARITLMTGNYPHSARGSFEQELKGDELREEIRQHPFWPQRLRKSGYHTGMIGKWHIYSRLPAVRTDWDYAAYWHKKMVNAYYYGQKISINGAKPVDLNGYSVDRHTDLAIEYIDARAKADRPWYLWLCYSSPHSPQTPAKRHQGKLANENDVPIPASFKTPRVGKPNYVRNKPTPKEDSVQSLVRRYHECIMSIDENVGRLTDALRKSGQLENTVVIFTSDQGLAMGHHGHVKKKNAPYDATLHSPLIFRYPKQFPAGAVCDEPVCGPDLVQTMHELCGIKPRKTMDGESLVPLLKRPGSELKRDVMLMTNTRTSFAEKIPAGVKRRNREAIELNEMPMWTMIRHEQFKYATYMGSGFEEVYDLENDPDELKNLAVTEDYAGLLSKLRRKAARALADTQSGFEAGHFIDYFPHLKKELNREQRKFEAAEAFDYSNPILFRTDFSSGRFDKLKISEDDNYAILKQSPERLTIVNAPDSPAGSKAARFTIPNSPGAFRTEIALPHEKGHQERWYSARIYVPADWRHGPNDEGDIVMQWHAIPGNWRATFPNLGIEIKRGKWAAQTSSGSPQKGPARKTIEIGEVEPGKWVRWIIHAKWSAGDDGRIRIWKDGKLTVDERGPNVYSTIGVEYTPYFKTGLYHARWKSQPDADAKTQSPTDRPAKTVYVKDIVVADKRADRKTVANVFAAAAAAESTVTQTRPNFLWLTIEDTSAFEFGCYGHPRAKTPNIDRLASRGVRYLNAWSNGPQCSTARSTLITGCYATTWNMDQHSFKWKQPADIPLYPPLLRAAGYYCTNNKKTHYNIDIDEEAIWDECHRHATYLSPKRKAGQPFFAIFNSAQTHMSRLTSVRVDGRRDFSAAGLDPAKLKLPPHAPDLPEVRSDYAFHLEGVQDVDRWVGIHLDTLKKEGLEEDTIVFSYSDHGGCLPRGKGWAYATGLHVPLVIYVPEKWQKQMGVKPGTVSDELVSFVDFAPTILSMIGKDTPDSMQGRAFLGPKKRRPRKYQFGFATNGWKNYIPARTVTDGRYQYIRNYTPFRPDCLRNSFQWAMPSNLAWDNYVLNDGGAREEWTRVFRPLKTERLYDLRADPFTMNDLSNVAELQDKLAELRQQVSRHIRDTGDLGFIPPLCRRAIEPAYQWVRRKCYDLSALHEAAEVASDADRQSVGKLKGYLRSDRPEIRYWGASGFSTLAAKKTKVGCPTELINAMRDKNAQVAVAAVEAVALLGESDKALAVFNTLTKEEPNRKDANRWLTSNFNVRSQAYASLAMLALYQHTRPMVAGFFQQNWSDVASKEMPYDVRELQVNLGLARAEILYDFTPERQAVNTRIRPPRPLPFPAGTARQDDR